MDIIVETDIGRDPDDFFALCYLVSAGVNIRAITISPGDLDQVALVKFFLKEVGLDIPIGVGRTGRTKSSVGGVHMELLRKYKFPKVCFHDGEGHKIIKEVHTQYPDAEFFNIGPLMSVGAYILTSRSLPIKRSTMQGGFIGYDIHGQDVPRLDKFEGLSVCPTFNLGGDKRGAISYVNCESIDERSWVGKNICHTIIYDKKVHSKIMAVEPKNRASELLREGMEMYLQKHDGKKFHDPSAAVCMLHPEIAKWVKASPYYENGKWGAFLNENGDNVCIDIDTDKLWDYISNGI